MTPLLELSDVRKGFSTPQGDRHEVLAIDHFSLMAGTEMALVGGSGTGKSTLLHVIAGILLPDAGTVRLKDRELTSLGEAARDRWRAQHVGIVFQTFQLLPGLTALENVTLAGAFAQGADTVRAQELLNRVGLADRLGYLPAQMSVGQQQRVAVARALMNRPSLVLADEPTGALDPERADESLELLREVCQEDDATLLVVTHDPRLKDSFEIVVNLHDLNRAGAPT